MEKSINKLGLTIDERAITYTDNLSSDLANKLKRLENPVLDFDNAKKENGHTEFLKKYFL